ncbi:hypothetical protein [Mucilaginibacter myungsuensis]|uniref:Uncharacterized protein n=1 Tax=Mucilaginibacter myungsuensis TaxID=649104 RepID=A0A929L555_9SPHI|nr:hypothetical protein [Mucilaginibacter myungsuensis]MBE9663406.1 hypothetical protein [Mucilaginibacter myungsuensis]
MGHKIVCLKCRKAFSRGTDNLHSPKECSECGGSYALYDHKFRPPTRSDINAWKVVSYLYDHGFNYQHINKEYVTPDRGYGYLILAEYPTTMQDAKEFVKRYKSQAKTFV